MKSIRRLVLGMLMYLPAWAQTATAPVVTTSGTVTQGWIGVFGGKNTGEVCGAVLAPGNTGAYSYNCYEAFYYKAKPLSTATETGLAFPIGTLQTKVGTANLYILGVAGGVTSASSALSLAASTGALMAIHLKDGWTVQLAVEWQKAGAIAQTIYKAGFGKELGGKK